MSKVYCDSKDCINYGEEGECISFSIKIDSDQFCEDYEEKESEKEEK